MQNVISISFGEADTLAYDFDVRVSSGTNPVTLKRYPVAWRVYLPHQCDEWDIAYADTREEAITELEEFIAEAQDALTQLRELPAPA